MASLPPRPSHPAPSEDSNRPLGPFFFTFRPSAVGSPVTVPGFFVPLQWPPPNAALTQPRGGSSFVFTDFSNDALPRPHPVWNAGNLPTQPPSQPRPPRPQPSRSSSHHSQPPGSSSFATWSAGQPGVTLIVSVNTGGHVDVSVPPSSTVRTAVPTASSSSGEHGTAPTTTASRSTQTSSTVTQETLTAPAKEVKTSPTHPGSRTRPSLPTDWISPQKGAKAHPSRRGSKSVSQKEVSEVEANLAESRTPSDVAGNEQAKQPSGRKTPTRTLRRMGTFYRPKVVVAEDDDNNGNVTKSSTSSVARSKNDQPDTPNTSNRLLGLLGLKTSSKSLSRLRAMAKSQSDIPPVPPIPKDVFRPGSADSERVLYPRAPMSSTPSTAPGPSRYPGSLEEARVNSFIRKVPASLTPPFRGRDASGGSIPSIDSVETMPTIDVISGKDIQSSPPYATGTLGRTDLEMLNRKLEMTLACMPSPRSVSEVIGSVPEPPANTTQEMAAVPVETPNGGVHTYNLSLPPQAPQFTPNGTMRTPQSLSPPGVNMSPSPLRPLRNAPHIFDIEHAFSGHVTSVPDGYVNADEVTLSPPKFAGGTLVWNTWEESNVTEGDATGGNATGGHVTESNGTESNAAESNAAESNATGSRPNSYHSNDSTGSGPNQAFIAGWSRNHAFIRREKVDPAQISMSQEAYNANCRQTLQDMFANTSVGAQNRSWADMSESSGSNTSKFRNSLNVSQMSNGSVEQSATFNQSQISSQLDQSQRSSQLSESQRSSQLSESQRSSQLSESQRSSQLNESQRSSQLSHSQRSTKSQGSTTSQYSTSSQQSVKSHAPVQQPNGHLKDQNSADGSDHESEKSIPSDEAQASDPDSYQTPQENSGSSSSSFSATGEVLGEILADSPWDQGLFYAWRSHEIYYPRDPEGLPTITEASDDEVLASPARLRPESRFSAPSSTSGSSATVRPDAE